MRKFLLPIINVVNLILVSIAWGLSTKTALLDTARNDAKSGNLYEIVWMGEKANAMGIIAFFLFIFGCALMLAAFLPIKARKYITCANGAFFIASGILFLLAPKTYDRAIIEVKYTGAFIAIAVLILVAGAFAALMSVLEFTEKKEK